MPAIAPSKFFHWKSTRLLLDIRPSEVFNKGSLDGARSIPIDTGKDFLELIEHFPLDRDSAMQPNSLWAPGSLQTSILALYSLSYAGSLEDASFLATTSTARL